MPYSRVLAFMCCVGFFPDGPATSAPDQPADSFPIAWGTPRDGIQAGLRAVRNEASRDTNELVAIGGVPLKFEVLVRNVGKEPIDITYLRPHSFGYTDAPVVQAMPSPQGKQVIEVSLEPLKTHRIGEVYIGFVRPKVNSAVDPRPFWTNSGEGLRHFGVVNVLSDPRDGKPPLNTGFVDVTLRRTR